MFQMTKQLCFVLELQHFFTLFLFLVTLSQESETKQVFPKVLGSRRSYVKVNLLYLSRNVGIPRTLFILTSILEALKLAIL